MTSAAAAPTSQPGGGTVVQEGSQRTTATNKAGVKRRRRTNVLSTLAPEERRAFLQEQLNGAAVLRQIAAMRHGALGPAEREVIGPIPTEEEYEEESINMGVSIEELKRREELARREAQVQAREEIQKRLDAEQHAPTIDPYGISEEEARKREELARREAAMKAEEDFRRRQAELDAQRPDPEPCLDGISEEEARQREDLARREGRLAAQEEAAKGSGRVPRPAPTTPPVSDDAGRAPSEPQAPPSWWDRWKTQIQGVGLGALIISGGVMGYNRWITDDSIKPPAATSDDEKALNLLRTQGLDVPQTPLGKSLLEAMERDPEFRIRIMNDAENILKQ